MKRETALIALLATGCTTMEPKYDRPAPAIPASWPVGDPYVAQAEAGLPVLTYQQVFQDARLQRLISLALSNNRDLLTAAANIAVMRFIGANHGGNAPSFGHVVFLSRCAGCSAD